MRSSEKKFSTASTAVKVEQIAGRLLEKKARGLLALDLAAERSLYEAAVIVSATSVRHGQGLADFVLDLCKEADYEFLHMEGYTVGQWILLDLNDVVVHIFQPDSRDLFRLDDLWPAAPVIADNREEARP